MKRSSFLYTFISSLGSPTISVAESITKQWMGMGPKTKEFEAKMAERLGIQHFLLVDSGSNGLYMAIKLLNLPVGSEIILPFNCIKTIYSHVTDHTTRFTFIFGINRMTCILYYWIT